MSKIRKGAIVWDKRSKEFTKVLNNPNKGEVPDYIFESIGSKYHSIMHDIALCKGDDFQTMKCNNVPCYLRQVTDLIPRKEYLTIQKELKTKYN